MKALITASTFSHIDQFHRPYLREFQHLGWEVHIACGGEEKRIPFVDQSMTVPFRKQMGSVCNLRATAMLRGMMVRGRYDLIITHTSLAAFFTCLAAKGLRNRSPLVKVMHGYLFDEKMTLRHRVLESAERLTTPETDLLLTMNQWDYEYASSNHLAKRIEKIPGMGVDFSRLDRATRADGLSLRTTLGIPEDAFVLLYAAEFSQRKSQHVLIQAMKALPKNALLVLCGSGANWADCRALAGELGVKSRVLFPGQVSDMPTWYRMADACVSASRSEGLPFNLMEAMYAGLPVIASRVKGHVDLIEDGKDGLLYEYGSVDACAEQIQCLMENTALRQAFSTAARTRAEAYRLEAVQPIVMSKYLSVLERVIT